MSTGHRRLAGLGSLTVALWLPMSATADVRTDPAVVVTTGVSWILLGAGVLALWASVALVWRLLRGTKTPLVTRKVVWILAALAVLGWLITVAALFLSPRPLPPRQTGDGGTPGALALRSPPIGVDGRRAIG